MLNYMISPERIVILTQDSILPYPAFPYPPINDGCRGITVFVSPICVLPFFFNILTTVTFYDMRNFCSLNVMWYDVKNTVTE
jgi:hypothetical protein